MYLNTVDPAISKSGQSMLVSDLWCLENFWNLWNVVVSEEPNEDNLMKKCEVIEAKGAHNP